MNGTKKERSYKSVLFQETAGPGTFLKMLKKRAAGGHRRRAFTG